MRPVDGISATCCPEKKGSVAQDPTGFYRSTVRSGETREETSFPTRMALCFCSSNKCALRFDANASGGVPHWRTTRRACVSVNNASSITLGESAFPELAFRSPKPADSTKAHRLIVSHEQKYAHEHEMSAACVSKLYERRQFLPGSGASSPTAGRAKRGT